MISLERVPAGRLSTVQIPPLRALLWSAFPGDFTEADWEHALSGDHVLLSDGVELVGHASVVPRPLVVGKAEGARSLHAGYVEAVAIAPHHQGRGLGTLMMQEVHRLITSTFDLGTLSTSTPAFYTRLGWRAWTGPSFVIVDGDWVRSPDEDSGIMVLQHGPSADLNLGLAIACQHRPGDAW